MTPQQLMDLPSAGMAEKALRKAGLWQLTPQEKLAKALDTLSYSIDEAADAIDDAQHDMTKAIKAMEAQCN